MNEFPITKDTLNWLFANTKTSPKDLLAWFKYILKNHKTMAFPCDIYPYKKRYQILHFKTWSFFTTVFGDKHVIDNNIYIDAFVFEIWNRARADHSYAKFLIQEFKKIYNLKEKHE